MKIPNMQLFLDRFISVNRVRYRQQPSVLAILNTLTLQNVIFSKVRSSNDAFGELVRTVDMYVPKVMKAMDQSWLPAYYTTPRITNMVTTDVQDENDLITLEVPGFYFYKDRYSKVQGCVVVPAQINPGDISDYVKDMVKNANAYQINDDQISVASNFSEVIVDTPAIYQRLKLVLSLRDFSFNIPDTDYGDLGV